MADKIIKAEDLLIDEGFLAFCLQKENADNGYWEDLMKNNPLQQKEILQAKGLLEVIVLKEKALPDEQLTRAHGRFVKATTPSASATINQRSIPMLWRWTAAAALLITVGLAVFFNVNKEQKSLQTVYGELKLEKLPDGSMVTLNANSKVTFSENWNSIAKREVWMEGEAYFEVSKTADRKPFIVHTGELDIEVTGTKFNVNKRGAGVKVFLVEGSITLHGAKSTKIPMKPGEYAELTAGEINKKAMTDAVITAWMDRKFVFDKTKMVDVARSLEEIYGISISFKDDQVSEKTISGILPNDNLSILLDALEAAYGFSIVSKDNEIVIGSK